jgi:quinoprotein glucose dehydrogenase
VFKQKENHMSSLPRIFITLATFLFACSLPLHAEEGTGTSAAASEWHAIGGDISGKKFSQLTQIDRSNVASLVPAWTFRSGDFSNGGSMESPPTSFEATPLMIADTLYFCTPYNRVIALDAASGKEKWRFDPKANIAGLPAPTCRGVTYWKDMQAVTDAACSERIFSGTGDARLIAIDRKTGAPCGDFGVGGAVNLTIGMGDVRVGEYWVSSPPVVIKDMIVVGSAVKDNQRSDAPGGAVRGFDARTGELKWVWDPVPPGMTAVTTDDVKKGAIITRGTPNVWSVLSADLDLGLVYLPTGNPTPDFYAGEKRGDKDYYGTSIVALDAMTGAVRWRFQTVHHDIWDYDMPAQPVLYEHRGVDGTITPAVIAATKLGTIFLLNRVDGTPIFPVEERPVPQTDVPGETTSPTQPFPTLPKPLAPISYGPEDVWGLTFWDKSKCRDIVNALDAKGTFTPISLKGTMVYPGLAGGINWDSVSVDPVANRMIVNVQIAAFSVKLVPRETVKDDFKGKMKLVGTDPQEGTPYVLERGPLLSPWGTPCFPPPWGKLVAVDLNTGNVLWDRPLGNLKGKAPLGLGRFFEWGTPNLGGSLQTAGGLAFIGATMDKEFRAFDTATGEELWQFDLPNVANATPMTYSVNGKQYVVVAAGGHKAMGNEAGDSLIAFALPDKK